MAIIKKPVSKQKKSTPLVNEEIESTKVIKKAPETALVVSEKIQGGKKDGLIEAFMAKVDFLISDVYKMFDRKMLTREEIEGIVNSILR